MDVDYIFNEECLRAMINQLTFGEKTDCFVDAGSLSKIIYH